MLAWEEHVPIAEAVLHHYTVSIDNQKAIPIETTCESITELISTCATLLPNMSVGLHHLIITIEGESSSVSVTIVEQSWFMRFLSGIQWGR